MMIDDEKTVQYKIVDKSGKVVEDVTFNDYEKLADHMLGLAEKWYTGLYDVDDTLEISTFDKTGELIYSDTATFGETMNDESSLEDELKQLAAIQHQPTNESSGRKSTKTRKKSKKS